MKNCVKYARIGVFPDSNVPTLFCTLFISGVIDYNGLLGYF